jgi:hypothetical protein
MMPEEFLNSYVEKFNARNLSSLIDMYETDACFVVQPGQIIYGLMKYKSKPAGFYCYEWQLGITSKRSNPDK